jgi:hypothetical protein
MPYHPVARDMQRFSLRPRPCAWCGENTGIEGTDYRGGRRVKGWWDALTYCSRSCEQAYRARKKAELED